MPNPSGVNQFPALAVGGAQDLGYGEKKRQGDLQRIGMPPTPALNAPERARKAGGKLLAPEQARQAAIAAPPPLTPTTLSQPMQSVAAWRMVASLPGVTPLAHQYLTRAEQESAYGSSPGPTPA